jgi:hypothetical protein
MFHDRTRGLTLRRKIEKAVYQPHGDGGKERFDLEFPVALRCQQCGKLGYGPRKNMQEAIREHTLHCPAKRSRLKQSEYGTQILYPPT